MGSDWLAVAAGLLFIAVMSAPLYLAPLNERWGSKRHYSTWEQEDETR